MAELLKYIVECGKQVAVGIRKVDVIGSSDGEAVPVRIMTQHVAAVASLAHVELEAVASLRKRIFVRSERVFNRQGRLAEPKTNVAATAMTQ